MPIGRKVTLLTSEQPASPALAHALVERGIELNGIVIQTRPSPATGWKDSLRWLLGDEAYLRASSLRWPKETREAVFAERRLQRNADQVLERSLSGQPKTFPPVRTLVTSDINSDETHRFLRADVPDLLVVYATGLLRRGTLSASHLGAVNAHTALLPDYRGADAEFWQLYHRAFDTTGITFHFIDEGVDTGDIVHRQHVPASEHTDPWMLRALNTALIVQEYPKAIDAILRGTASRSPQERPSTPCHRSRDLTDGHKRQLLRRLRLVGPERDTRVLVDRAVREYGGGPALAPAGKWVPLLMLVAVTTVVGGSSLLLSRR